MALHTILFIFVIFLSVTKISNATDGERDLKVELRCRGRADFTSKVVVSHFLNSHNCACTSVTPQPATLDMFDHKPQAHEENKLEKVLENHAAITKLKNPNKKLNENLENDFKRQPRHPRYKPYSRHGDGGPEKINTQGFEGSDMGFRKDEIVIGFPKNSKTHSDQKEISDKIVVPQKDGVINQEELELTNLDTGEQSIPFWRKDF